ncbi:MAG: methylaspartate mutase subunit E [Desulfarculaceae bacterium]|jgi:methylaspartate mutase epsilon subunit
MADKKSHCIVVGGIGGDSHSVGLTILRQALRVNGYDVCFLGIQNRLEEFFNLAPFVNVVMISCMDGHARQYLRDFPELKSQRHLGPRPLWYLGGNLTIGDALGWEDRFRQMGFDRAFVKFVDMETVLGFLARDLDQAEPVGLPPGFWEKLRPGGPALEGNEADTLMPEDDFLRQRREVLEHWKTGVQAQGLESNAEYLIKQPGFPEAQQMVNRGQAPPLIQPRSGVALLRQQIEYFKAFKALGVRVVSYQVDSFTRNNNYPGAEEAIRDSWREGTSVLNGFPVVNHGVLGLRRVMAEVGLPVQTRHSTRDPRLLAEVSFAGGVTAYEGGPICYNIPYYRDYPLSQSIKNWRYVDRLAGLYHERYGIRLDREFFGVLTGTLIPPSLAIVTGLLEAILAVQQGVRCVSLGYAEQGNRIQDVAAIRVMGAVAREVMDNLGYKSVQTNCIYHQFMAAFPTIPKLAEDLISNSGVTAALSRPTRVMVKTPVESYKIPTLADNLHGVSLVMAAMNNAQGVELDARAVKAECTIIRQEVDNIFQSVLLAGGGSVAQGVIKAFELGYLDIPFSPNAQNQGLLLTARDNEGAVRFAQPGNLQLDKDLLEFHQDKMSDRRRSEGLKTPRQDYQLVNKDVLQIARGQYQRWPLFG